VTDTTDHPKPTRLSDASWRKSRHSSNEAASRPPSSPTAASPSATARTAAGRPLIYTPREWRTFLKGAKDGEFDLG